MQRNYYQILEVSYTASPEMIRAAFVLLSQQYHPDNVESGNLARSQEIGEAYAVLKNPAKRKEYDEKLVAEQQQQAARHQAQRGRPQPVDPYSDGFNSTAYPGAYDFADFGELDFDVLVQDVVSQSAAAAGGAFLGSILSQMGPQARRVILEAMEKARRGKRGAA